MRRNSFTLSLPFDFTSRFQVLELKNYALKINSLPNGESPNNLTTLKLTYVSLTQDTLEGILSNCLFLEKLSLVECKFDKGVKIHSKSVKVLELTGMVVQEIHVCAEKLSVMEVDTMICKPTGLAIETPNLRAFHSRCNLECGVVKSLSFERIVLTTREILQSCISTLVSTISSFSAQFNVWID